MTPYKCGVENQKANKTIHNSFTNARKQKKKESKRNDPLHKYYIISAGGKKKKKQFIDDTQKLKLRSMSVLSI